MSLSNRSGRLLSASANPGAHPATTAKYSLAATRTCRPKTDSIDGLSGSGAVTQALNTAVTVQRTPRSPFLTYSLPLIFAKVIPVPTRPCPSRSILASAGFKLSIAQQPHPQHHHPAYPNTKCQPPTVFQWTYRALRFCVTSLMYIVIPPTRQKACPMHRWRALKSPSAPCPLCPPIKPRLEILPCATRTKLYRASVSFT